jgi:hypothetical protein
MKAHGEGESQKRHLHRTQEDVSVSATQGRQLSLSPALLEVLSG